MTHCLWRFPPCHGFGLCRAPSLSGHQPIASSLSIYDIIEPMAGSLWGPPLRRLHLKL